MDEIKKLQAPRLPIRMTDSIADSLPLMSEGDPEALKIITNIVKLGTQAALLVLDMDDMNIRGEQIVVAYRDICKLDTIKFLNAIKARDPFLVKRLNVLCQKHYAVTGGAALGRTKYQDYYV